MKLLLIKIGKAWSVLRRDGIKSGGRRIFSALGSFTKSIPEGEILLVSGGVGDSARYRTKHVAEELNLHGFRASYTVQDSPFFSETVERFRVIVFHRVVFTESVARYIARAKELGRTLLFETDDLVYDPKYLHLMDYYTKMNSLEKKLYENGVGGEILADPYVEYATTSTSFLKRKLEERGKRVFLVTNKMCEEDVAWAEEIRMNTKRDVDTVRISYLSGTPSHNKDFATITGALIRILGEFPQARLVLAGPLDMEDMLNQYTEQIIRVPFAPRKEYFATVASADINVAPLEMDNDFCEAKSELKFFEAGLLGVPTVAVANETYRGAITDGVDGFVAATEDEWYEKLKLLIVDTELRENMRQKALETALARYTTKQATSPEYYDFLRSILK
ncbi:MAG: glycosyltransferase [Candidatus Moranbacteria bacterium]|nr:glycosyltransferase [Candidatus Moranbacteria bacterium]